MPLAWRGLQGSKEERTACINRIRGLLAEFGLVFPQSPKALRQVLPAVLEDASNEMGGVARLALQRAQKQWEELDAPMNQCDERVGAHVKNNEQTKAAAKLHDIGLIDAAQLRRQIGVVLQENLLFNRSVRENIAITDPAAPIEAVMHAAQLAGAHEFVAELPEGYDTIVGEQGASLSGGQRQRIAIARALFTHPRILILDEATSALDYESEAVLHTNMGAICQGRTVIIIAHRLSSVRNANRIIVMDKGRIVEEGAHEALLQMPGGLYAHLWGMQGGVAASAAAAAVAVAARNESTE